MPARDDDLTLEELYRRAIREAQNSEHSEIALSSLLAAAEDDNNLLQAAAEELAPRAAELELHLNGADVRDHATNAKAFGTLVLRIAEASKQYVKSALNATRLSSDLMVAPGPGSVRATFLAPDPAIAADGAFSDVTNKGPVWTHSNVQSESLHKIAVVLANADPDTPESEALDGAIQQLPPAARRELRKAIAEVVRREWSVTGEFRQRGIGREAVELNPAAARYLSSRLQDDEAEVETLRTTGVVDGHRWSTGLMYFRPGGSGRPFHASFASAELQEAVAALAAVDGRQVEATFIVYIYHSPGTSDSSRRSYVLQSVTALDSGPQSQLSIE